MIKTKEDLKYYIEQDRINCKQGEEGISLSDNIL